MAVEGLSGEILQRRLIKFHLLELALVFAVLGELLFVGVDDDDAAVAVDDDHVAAGNVGGEIAQSDDRRDAHGAGDDRGVAGAAADVGREPDHVLAVQGRRLAGQQVVGDHDHVLRKVREVLSLPADEGPQQPLLDVRHPSPSCRDGHRAGRT